MNDIYQVVLKPSDSVQYQSILNFMEARGYYLNSSNPETNIGSDSYCIFVKSERMEDTLQRVLDRYAATLSDDFREIAREVARKEIESTAVFKAIENKATKTSKFRRN